MKLVLFSYISHKSVDRILNNEFALFVCPVLSPVLIVLRSFAPVPTIRVLKRIKSLSFLDPDPALFFLPGIILELGGRKKERNAILCI